MKIACLMMQKNESKLLKPWLEYHSTIFGLNNIYVYDNGSTDASCIETLRRYESRGLNVNWDHKTQKDFEKTGSIFCEKIKQFDNSDSPYDFYFPMDCDEFIAYERTFGDLLLDRNSIILELKNHIDEKNTLAINAGYDNNPVFSDSYYRSKEQRKCFFYKKTCSSISQGFHIGKTFSGTETKKTKIVYIHHHYKEFHDYQFSAKQKLTGVVTDFSIASLEKHKELRVPGFHVIDKLLITEENYYRSHLDAFNIRKKDFYKLSFVSCFLKGLGININIPEHLKIKILLNKNFIGHIDSLAILNDTVELKGWALSAKDQVIDSIYIYGDNNTSLSIFKIKRYNRPDVLNSFPGSNLKSGIKAELPLSEEVNAVLKSKNISILVGTENSYSKLNFNGMIHIST
ncbi:glycosyltransferase family 2 protein [Leclercia adecarboxylata]|uniref:glycosyltransferase family 2 protein n=1 Tax=Leclercia adecarboxylata TaxID=83655 RepID=UPI001331303C|nr:glycosyltransferase family 2 protein [Leclercia adecarboxylata]